MLSTANPTSFPFLSFVPPVDELTRAFHLLQSNDVPSAPRAARLLRETLDNLRRQCSTEDEWRRCIQEELRTHPVAGAVLQDPFVRRAYQKPRGYAGDAVMLDFIYQHPSVAPAIDAAPPIVQSLMQFTTNAQGPRGVRNRAALLAGEIDATARRVSQPAILSLACGHLREARMSRALREGKVGRFLALDQDVESLAVVTAETGGFGVEAREGSVKTVIARGKELGQFDFVYAAGLYDYLNDKLAARLLQALFERVKPGGKVWIANFLPDIQDRGYMEAYMDWWLIYRDAAQMRQLGDALPADEVATMRTFAEHDDAVVFLEAVRRG